MADPTASPPRAPRLWRVVLIVSLALNLAVFGLVGGAFMSGKFAGGPPGRVDFGLGPVARAMSGDDRREIGRALRQHSGLRVQDLRGQMATLAGALRADPFDAAALQTVLDDQAARLSQLQASARQAMLDRISAMSTAERRAVADRLEEDMQHNRRPQNAASRD